MPAHPDYLKFLSDAEKSAERSRVRFLRDMAKITPLTAYLIPGTPHTGKAHIPAVQVQQPLEEDVIDAYAQVGHTYAEEDVTPAHGPSYTLHRLDGSIHHCSYRPAEVYACRAQLLAAVHSFGAIQPTSTAGKLLPHLPALTTSHQYSEQDVIDACKKHGLDYEERIMSSPYGSTTEHWLAGSRYGVSYNDQDIDYSREMIMGYVTPVYVTGEQGIRSPARTLPVKNGVSNARRVPCSRSVHHGHHPEDESCGYC